MKNAISVTIFAIFFFLDTIAFAEQSSAAHTISTYANWIETLVMILGLIFLGWYQKYQISILKKELESHKSIISSLKQYSEILDVKKLKEFVELSEETIRKKSEIEMIAIQSDMTAKIKAFEEEKEILLLEISKSSEMTDKIKSQYEAVIQRSSQTVILFYCYILLARKQLKLTLVQERLLIYATSLFYLRGIFDSKFEDYLAEVSRLSSNLHDILNSFDDLNLLNLKEDVTIPIAWSTFNQDKFEEDTMRLATSLFHDIDEIIKTIKVTVKNQ